MALHDEIRSEVKFNFILYIYKLIKYTSIFKQHTVSPLVQLINNEVAAAFDTDADYDCMIDSDDKESDSEVPCKCSRFEIDEYSF